MENQHTYLYLQRDSHHTIPSKYSVAGTLYHGAKLLCSNAQLLQEEEHHLFQALKRCKYPTWAINRVKIKSQNPNQNTTRRNTNQSGQNNINNKNLYMVVPYHQGLSESIKKSCKKVGVQVYFKRAQTIKNLLMTPREKNPITKKSEVIYRYKCDEIGCDEEYIEESARTFAERFKGHQKDPSPIFDHCNISGHKVNIDKTRISQEQSKKLYS